MHSDKFTTPLMDWLIQTFGSTHKQTFVILDEQVIEGRAENLSSNTIIIRLPLPIRKFWFKHLSIVLPLFKQAQSIIMHGNTLLLYLFLNKNYAKKTSWIIYGGIDMPLAKKSNILDIKTSLQNAMKKIVLKQVNKHITHIKGDSDWCNTTYHSNAQFFYSPIYLSNTTHTQNFLPLWVEPKNKWTIMLGNSADPSNKHGEIFELLLPFKNQIQIICPLSYGNYPDYKKTIIDKGKALFGGAFEVLDYFMPIDAYNAFLQKIDIAIFNHKRQEAMGVTLSLLALGKIVYMNPTTTAYDSFIERGFKVFDIDELKNRNSLFAIKDVAANKELLEKYYSMQVLKDSWAHIYEELPNK